MSLIRQGLLLAALLFTPVWAETPALQTIQIPFVPGQPPVQLQLPEGYSLRTVDGMEGEYLFCPWNEYFTLRTSRLAPASGKPIADEKGMSAELEAFAKANPSLKFRNAKSWMTPQGPRGWLETVTGEKTKEMIGCNLFVPRKGDMLLFTIIGSTSSLPDQKIIQDLFLKQVKL